MKESIRKRLASDTRRQYPLAGKALDCDRLRVSTQLFEGRYRNGGRLESGTRRHADIASAEGHLSELSKGHPNALS
jgi:hypothetical protein